MLDLPHVTCLFLSEVYATPSKGSQTQPLLDDHEANLLTKAATSFECDGCQHHASYHSLENPEEDAVLKKWEAHETSNTTLKHAITGANRKRKRIAAKPPGEDQDLREIIELADVEDEVVDDQLEDQLQAELLEARTKRSRKRAA